MNTPPIGTKVLVTHLAERKALVLSCFAPLSGAKLIFWVKRPCAPFLATITGARRCWDGKYVIGTYDDPTTWTGYHYELYPVVRVNVHDKEKIIAGWLDASRV